MFMYSFSYIINKDAMCLKLTLQIDYNTELSDNSE